MSTIDLTIVFIYLAGMLVVGAVANKKQKDMEDYYVAGRKLNTFSIMCLWVAGWIGGASVIGASSKAYDMGITAIWYVGIAAIGCVIFATTFTKIVKRVSTKFHNVTYPDFIAARYDEKTRIITTITTIIAYFAYTAGQFIAGGVMLQALTGWEANTCIIICAIVIILYTSAGGMIAVTYTDWFQVILLVVGIVVIGVPITISFLDGGIASLKSLPASYFDIGAWGWPSIIALGVSTILSFYTTMDGYTRCFAAKDEKAARNGILWAAAVVVVIALSSTFLGMAAKVIIPDATGSTALTLLIVKLFPAGLRGLIIVGVLAAIMSTADICMLVASANITKDIYQKMIKKDATDKQLMKVGITSSLLVGIFSVAIAIGSEDIIDTLFIAFTINSAGLFLPTVCGIFWKKASSNAAFISMTAALTVILGWMLAGKFSANTLFEIDALWPGIIISAILFFIISLVDKKSPAEIEKTKEFMEAIKVK